MEKWAELIPTSVGDAYLLIGYPFHDQATVGIAYPALGGGRFSWMLETDDNDHHAFDFDNQQEFDHVKEMIGCQEIILLRRAHEGLWEKCPAEYRDIAFWRGSG